MASDEKKVGMKKTLGMWHGVSVIFSTVVGSGIFITANSVLEQCGSIGMTLIIWALCAFLVSCGAFMYIELGCAMPSAGGDYEYISRSLGDLYAFLFGYCRILLIVPSSLAVSGLSFGNYLLQPFFPCGVPHQAKVLFAVLAISFFAYLNCRSVPVVTKIQLAFAAGKAAALTTVVLAGIYSISKGRTDNFRNAFHGTNGVMSIINGFYGCIFTFSGWNYLNYVAGELKNPEKNLPRAAVIAIGAIACLYLMVNASYFSLLTKQDAIASQAIGVDAMRTIWSPLGYLVSAFVSMSVFGLINSMMFTSSRVVFTAATKNHVPELMAYLHIDCDTPVPSVITCTLMAILFLCFGTATSLIYVVAFCESLFFVVTFMGFLRLRKDKSLNRPFKAFFPIVLLFGVAMIFITIAGIIQQPMSCVISLAIIVSGIPVYFAGVKHQFPLNVQRKLAKCYKVAQIVCGSVPVDVEH